MKYTIKLTQLLLFLATNKCSTIVHNYSVEFWARFALQTVCSPKNRKYRWFRLPKYRSVIMVICYFHPNKQTESSDIGIGHFFLRYSYSCLHFELWVSRLVSHSLTLPHSGVTRSINTDLGKKRETNENERITPTPKLLINCQ